MKRMGIDFGSKKIGVALTDDAGKMAFPHAVVPNDDQFMQFIEALVVERGVEEIVIGYSLDNQGDPNAIHTVVQEFVADATLHIGVPIHLEPEQYTSQAAAQVQGKNQLIDASAAALILDSFITKHK
jgi:putative Holliday junction resolvase